MIRDGKPPESSDNEPNKNPGFAENQTELESKKNVQKSSDVNPCS